MEHTQCLIIGSGPAGYTAAIYAARAGLKPILYTGMQAGGQLMLTTDIDNFPGYPTGIKGTDMMEDLQSQAERFGTLVRFEQVQEVNLSAPPFSVHIDGGESVVADSVIIATGASAKWLGLDSEQKYNGHGVSACAICDGFFYKNEEVAICGGGDTAAEEALYLAKLCKKVYMIIRSDKFRASTVMAERVLTTPNIEVLYHNKIEEILGDGKIVTGIRMVDNKTDQKTDLAVTGVFIAIGHHPNTELFKDQIKMDADGYINTEPGSTRTNIEGVFCCGDAQDRIYRQAITAAGTGCMAALDAERYLAHYTRKVSLA